MSGGSGAVPSFGAATTTLTRWAVNSMARLIRAVFNRNSRKWFLVAVVLSLLLVTAALLVHQRRSAGFAFGLLRHHSMQDGIDIYGDAEFVHTIGESLQKIQKRSPNEYSVIRPFVGRIEQARATYLYLRRYFL